MLKTLALFTCNSDDKTHAFQNEIAVPLILSFKALLEIFGWVGVVDCFVLKYACGDRGRSAELGRWEGGGWG